MRWVRWVLVPIWLALSRSDSPSPLVVGGDSYFIRGIAYSPVPRGGDARLKWPYGDYFAPGFSELWERDFPLLSSMGANTLRVYHWLRDQDHTSFLDTAHRYGLKVGLAACGR
jgi:hypothetical protein